MTTLFIVHAEEMFREWFGQDFEANLCKLAYAGGFDRVINLCSEVGTGSGLERDTISSVDHPDFETWCWSWGYEPIAYDEYDQDEYWVIPTGNAHEWTWVPPEVRDWPTSADPVVVAGGCFDECLDDWLCVLEHQGIPYQVAEGATY